MDCDGCTACCTVCVVPELNKKAGDKCSKCTIGGCSEYSARPKSCVEFECAYYQGGTNIELRPDKCGIMFFKKSDNIFCAVKVVGVDVTPIATRQLNNFKEQGYSVIALEIGEKPQLMLAEGHNSEDIYQEYIGLLREWQLTAQT